MHVPSITAVGSIANKKLTLTEKKITKRMDNEIKVKVKYG